MPGDRYVEALLWMDRERPIDDAELVVRLARPTRWAGARFSPSDVERASRAIARDPHYLREVAHDAEATVRSAGGVGLRRLRRAVLTIKREAPDAG